MNNLKILGKTFEVVFLEEDDSPNQLGSCHLEAQRIEIRKGTPRETELDTLLHEVIHACDDSLGLGMTERQVHAMACALVGVFLDNQKTLLEYLVPKKEK